MNKRDQFNHLCATERAERSMSARSAYLLIAGRLYLTTGDCSGAEPGNLYPCSLGVFGGHPGDLPGGALTANDGDEIQLFGRRYEVNCLPTDGACEDEIDLELVYLSRRDNPEDGADLCAACGRVLEDTPSGPRCPIMSLHTVEDFDKGAE